MDTLYSFSISARRSRGAYCCDVRFRASNPVMSLAVVGFVQTVRWFTESTLYIENKVCLAVAFLGCTLGRCFCPWLGFRGGKGIAVAVGCLFSAFGPVGALLEIAIFAVLVVATKYVSVGSIAAAVACPFFALYFFWGNPVAFVLCLLVGLTVVWAHRENIARLRAGTENRIGSKKKA